MKSRSTIWYWNFFMTQHDDQRWVEPFQVTRVILQIVKKLQPLIEKIHQMKFVILIGIWVAHGVNYFNAMRCFPFENLPSISCYISLFMQLMLCLKSKSNGHNEKIVLSDGWFQRLVQFPFPSWCDQLHTYSYSKAQWCFCCRLYYFYKSKAYNI